MIPLKLQIKNFLSYGPEIQTIDFTPHNLICFSGKNGHGKSALLDAITWALWGQARKLQGAVKSDEAILRLGQKHMMVSFDFSLNNNIYRIKREFTLIHSKAYSSLDFGLLNNQTNSFLSLTEKKIRDTQEKINKILGLEFEAFINSAFLRQGQSNEFSKKSAKERKEILSTIIGLGFYDELKKLALEKIRVADSQKQQYEKLQERLLSELTKENELNVKIENLEKMLVNIQQQENLKREEILTVEQWKKNHAQKQQERNLLEFEYEREISDLSQRISALKQTINDWRQTHRELIKLPDKKALETQKKLIDEKLKEYQLTIHKYLKIKEKLLESREREQQIYALLLEQQTQRISQQTIIVKQLDLSIKSNKQKYDEIIKNESQSDLELMQIVRNINTVQKKVIENQNLLANFAFLQKQFEKRRTFYHSYDAHKNSINLELESIIQKKKLTQDILNPSCPLCEQNLSASRKRFLQEQFARRESWLQHRLNRVKRLLTDLKQTLVKQHEELQKLRKIQEEQAALQAQLNECIKQRERLILQKNNFEKEKAKIKDLEQLITSEHKEAELALQIIEQAFAKKLEEQEEYQLIKKTIVRLTQELNDSSQAHDKYEMLINELKLIENQLHTHENSNEKKLMQKERIKKIDLDRKERMQHKKVLDDIKAKLHNYNSIDKEGKDLDFKHNQLINNLEEINKQKEQLLQENGSFKATKSAYAQMKKEVQSNNLTIKQLDESIDDYYEIAKAVGKDGIQALLIEEIIPEIEQEANNILARLTDNQAHISIESVRDLKKGGTKETLDINISDAAGIRSYELFSGGEAFRIDFALRIAISKLLARKAGASLQTLIIDEGFGSQDEEGLAHIMDALIKIQNDFSKIIVVSHLESMKEQFPINFLVEKNLSGSTVKVIQQG